MRRSEKQVKSIEEIMKVIDACEVCRLAMFDDEAPYIVPLNFGYEMDDELLRLYFHCATDGKKLDLIQKNGNVCFEMDCCHALKPGQAACSYSYKFASIIGKGKAELLSSYEEKCKALQSIMKQATKKDGFTFSEAMVNKVAVICVASSDFTCKQSN